MDSKKQKIITSAFPDLKEADVSPQIKAAEQEASPNEMLVALAMHPDTPEQEWLAACEELNKRNIVLPCTPPKRVNKKSQKIALAAMVASFAILGAAGGYLAQHYFDAAAKAKDLPYNRSSADWQTIALDQQLASKAANAISEKGWNAEQAAEQTGMEPKKVKSLLEGKDELSMKEKVQMLFAMDKPVRLVNASAKWTRSSDGEYEKSDYQDKINYCTRVLSSNPNKLAILLKRAGAYESLNQKELALADYNRCLQIDPNNVCALNNRANINRDLQHYQLALNDIDILIKRDPDDWGTFMNRGLTYLSMNQAEKALPDFNKAVAMAPERPGPLCNRAHTYEMLGKYSEAISDWQKCINKDPTYSYADKRIEELRQLLAQKK